MSIDPELTTPSPELRTSPALEPQEQAVQLLEGFLALMPDAALVVDEQGRIVSLNEQAESLFRYHAADLVGRDVEVLVPERFRHLHRRDRDAYLAAPLTRPMGAGLELRGRRRDGSEFPLDISLAPLTDVERPLVVAAIRDATERRALTAAQAQLAAIVQSSMDGIVSTTVEGAITSWNSGAERLFGYSGSEIVGRHISALVPEDSSTAFEELLGAVVAGESPDPRDMRWRRQDGTPLEVSVTLSGLTDPGGQPLGFSAVIRNNTERKETVDSLRRVLALERRRKEQQEATAEIRLAILSGVEVDEVLTLICDRAHQLVGAEAAGIVVPEDGQLRIRAAVGGSSHLVGATLRPGASLAGRAITSGTNQVVASYADDPAMDPEIAAIIPSGPALAVVIASEGVVNGALSVSRSRHAAEFGDDDVTFAAGLAGQAALAFELARARVDREQLMLVRDHDRIAHDLHDVVIQRLFAAAMALEGVARLSRDQAVTERVSGAIDELDTTIREIRNTIFGLEARSSDAPPG